MWYLKVFITFPKKNEEYGGIHRKKNRKKHNCNASPTDQVEVKQQLAPLLIESVGRNEATKLWLIFSLKKQLMRWKLLLPTEKIVWGWKKGVNILNLTGWIFVPFRMLIIVNVLRNDKLKINENYGPDSMFMLRLWCHVTNLKDRGVGCSVSTHEQHKPLEIKSWVMHNWSRVHVSLLLCLVHRYRFQSWPSRPNSTNH